MHLFLKLCRKQDLKLQTKVIAIIAFKQFFSLNVLVSTHVENKSTITKHCYNSTSFYNFPCIYFHWCPDFSIWLLATIQCPFIRPYRSLLNISCRTWSLLATKSHSYCLSGNVLVSPSLLKDSCHIQDSQLTCCCCFSILNMCISPLCSGPQSF